MPEHPNDQHSKASRPGEERMEQLLGRVAAEDRAAAPVGLEDRLFAATRSKPALKLVGSTAASGPSRRRLPLVGFAAAAAVLLVAGVGVWKAGWLSASQPAAAPNELLSAEMNAAESELDAAEIELEIWIASLDALEGDVSGEIDLLLAEVASLDEAWDAGLGASADVATDWLDLGGAL
ncbi:MAG: hypothetical protein AAF138_09005 [Planctomycetota bacterium]